MKACVKAALGSALVALLAACAARGPARAPAAPASTTAPQAQPTPPLETDAEQRFQAALDLMKNHKTDEARAAFASLAKDYPQYSGPLADLGVLYARSNQRQLALNSFAAAVAANPKNAFAYGWLGILYRENGEYARAEDAYRKALALNPNDATAHLNLGILYDVYLKRPKDALTQYQEYQRLSGDQARPIVAAWIRELQDQLGGGTPAAAATATGMEHNP
jgi:Flp pilus assembly protein TadD